MNDIALLKSIKFKVYLILALISIILICVCVLMIANINEQVKVDIEKVQLHCNNTGNFFTIMNVQETGSGFITLLYGLDKFQMNLASEESFTFNSSTVLANGVIIFDGLTKVDYKAYSIDFQECTYKPSTDPLASDYNHPEFMEQVK